jgi:hypothetical protein
LPVDSGRVYVVGSVPVLHPEAATVDEMLEGWRNQQLCRNLDHDTIAGRAYVTLRQPHRHLLPWHTTNEVGDQIMPRVTGRLLRTPRRSAILVQDSTVACGC